MRVDIEHHSCCMLLSWIKMYLTIVSFCLQAKPLMGQGDSAFDSLLDPRAKFTPKSSKLISQMVRAAAACVSNEESSRPSINEASSFCWKEKVALLRVRQVLAVEEVILTYYNEQKAKWRVMWLWLCLEFLSWKMMISCMADDTWVKCYPFSFSLVNVHSFLF